MNEQIIILLSDWPRFMTWLTHRAAHSLFLCQFHHSLSLSLVRNLQYPWHMYVSLGAVLNIYVRPGKELVHPVRYPKAAVIKKESWGRFSDQYCPTALKTFCKSYQLQLSFQSLTNGRHRIAHKLFSARFFFRYLHTNTHKIFLTTPHHNKFS